MPQEIPLEKEPAPAEIKTTEAKEISQVPSSSVISSEQVVSVESPSPIIASASVEETTAEKRDTQAFIFQFLSLQKAQSFRKSTIRKRTFSDWPDYYWQGAGI